MRSQAKVGMILTAIALTTTIPFADPLLTPLIALADNIRSYGTDGSAGRNGRNGRNGEAGRPRTVRADGTPQQVYAIGTSGSDGEDGENGERPYCRAQPRDVDYDLQAADGGSGGNGGSGGDGGNGGEVTIYYIDPADLRLIYVDAQGGQPGRGGRGGLGADGCECDDHGWRVQVCEDGNCEEDRYICRDGDDGSYGRNGRDGRVGEFGQMRLINQLDPLLPETPTQTQSLETFLQRPVQLSSNLWETRSGAAPLLASGSLVADVYQAYVERVEGAAQVVWEAPRSQTAFLAVSPTAILQDSGAIQVQFPDTLWVEGRQEQTGDLATYTVTGVVRANEATRLALGNMNGQGADFTVAVVDLAAESDHLETRFELLYRTARGNNRDDRRLRYTTRYEGEIPADLITRDNNRFVLALGGLPVDARYFRPGTHVRAELRVTRSLGANSATQTLEWQRQL
ncbi:MAG: collagen-like protein [Leptolyngbya sp. SIO1D8]|nr:collagen-like protein [Leptolyngbya sp. SIO1D8]